MNEFPEDSQHEEYLNASDLKPGIHVRKVRTGSDVAETMLLRLE